MSDIPTLKDLMNAMNFDAHDIDENRSRRLSSAQRQRLQRLQQRNILIGAGVFVVMAFVASLCIYIGQSRQEIVFGFLGMLFTVMNAIAIGYVARGYLRINADLRNETPVQIYESILHRVIRPNGQVNNYVLVSLASNKSFSVTKDVFKVFRHEKVYSLYATLHSNILLSAECLMPECYEPPQIGE